MSTDSDISLTQRLLDPNLALPKGGHVCEIRKTQVEYSSNYVPPRTEKNKKTDTQIYAS